VANPSRSPECYEYAARQQLITKRIIFFNLLGEKVHLLLIIRSSFWTSTDIAASSFLILVVSCHTLSAIETFGVVAAANTFTRLTITRWSIATTVARYADEASSISMFVVAFNTFL
jgi:hypothetical protein